MRALSRILAGLVGLLGLALLMVSASVAPAAPAFPESGILVYKDLRGVGVTEIRDADTGQILAQESFFGRKALRHSACGDRHRRFIGARWPAYESYYINTGSLEGIAASSTPGHFLTGAEVEADLVAGHAAWQTPMTTDCTRFNRTSPYQANYRGSTDAHASLLNAEPVSDGVNIVEFRSLEGTFCDGALACTIVDFEHRRINEVDMVFEKDLVRLSGFPDFWSTDDMTLVLPDAGTFAVIDTAVHEFGHYLGLDHVENSPELTMFPLIHDGAQTLGRGDMIGVSRLYRRGPVGPEDADD